MAAATLLSFLDSTVWYVWLCVCVLVCLFVCAFVCLFVCLDGCLIGCGFVRLCVCSRICLVALTVLLVCVLFPWAIAEGSLFRRSFVPVAAQAGGVALSGTHPLSGL